MKSCSAVNLLKEAGFNFVLHFESLLIVLEIETDEKRRLMKRVKMDDSYQFSTEEAIDSWLKNCTFTHGTYTWKDFIEVIKKCEPSTANEIKKILSSKK